MKREINLKNVKGSYDYNPREQRIRNYIQDTLRKVFEEYGYQPLETPILCYYDLLAGKYDETNDLLNEIYKLSDQGERKLGLRYDLTVPFAKYIAITKDIRLPFKRYEMGKVFRDGPVKVGRDREFMQCDVDVVGLDGNLIEAELLSVWFRGYNDMGIEVYIKYNSRNLMRGLIQNEIPDLTEDDIDRVVTVIDKLDKLKKEELLTELISVGVPSIEVADKLLSYFEKSLDELNDLFKDTENEMLKKGLEELINLRDILRETDLEEACIFSPSLARGQDYYTGNVFEVYAKNGEVTCSIGGGGRYDKMVTDFIDDGNAYPAVGVSFGLSSIYEILKMRDEFKNSAPVDIFIIPLDSECSNAASIESLNIACSLRALGYRVDVEFTGKKLKKSFEYANRENIPYVIVIGEDEVKNGKFKLKNMETGAETEIDIKDLSAIEDVIVL